MHDLWALPLSWLDLARSRALRVTLAVAPLRAMFVQRAWRLGFLFALALPLQVYLSCQFPLWMLALGPLIYGFPHLYASLRYFAPTRVRFRLLPILIAIFTLVAIGRLAFDLGFVPRTSEVSGLDTLAGWLSIGTWGAPMRLEVLGLLSTALVASWWMNRKIGRTFFGVALCAPLAYVAWNYPAWTTGVLLLGHNFVGFGYWINLAKRGRERAVAVASLSAFIAVHAAIFAGLLDFAFSTDASGTALAWAGLDAAQIGQAIAPWSVDGMVFYRCVVAYAFGQGLHYFVWLKAIPDSDFTREVPASFRETGRLLLRDFGRQAGIWIPLSLLAGAALWAFTQYPYARLAYFSVAAYHSYLEIAGLAVAATLFGSVASSTAAPSSR